MNVWYDTFEINKKKKFLHINVFKNSIKQHKTCTVSIYTRYHIFPNIIYNIRLLQTVKKERKR